MEKNHLIQQLYGYSSNYEEEHNFIPRFISLLINFENCFSRALLSGHITASSFVVDNEGQSVLLLHHKKLNKWLQPGGHADGDENVLKVATREAVEETGLQSLRLVSTSIFDLDIHVIPEYKGTRCHFHYDVRYLFTADSREALRLSSESYDAAWIPLASVRDVAGENASIGRMCDKLS